MDRSVLPLLLGTFDEAATRLRARLTGLPTEEYLWAPVEGGWTVRPGDGGWAADPHVRSEPPVPVPTIAWRLWHLSSDCLATYVSPSLGPWPLPIGAGPDDRAWYGEPEPALAAFDTACDAFRQRLGALGEDGAWQPLGPDWGPFADDPWAALVLHALDELAHHGAEIALLRDLYGRLD